MDDITLVTPPISFLGYPLITLPLLSSILKQNNLKARIEESNVSFLNYFLKNKKEIVKSSVDFNQSSLNKKIKFNLALAKLFDPEKDYIVPFIMEADDFDESWVNSFIKKPSPIIYFSFHHFRTSLKSFPWVNKVIEKIKSIYPNILIIVGGSYFVFYTEKEIKYFFDKYKFVDCIILGEEELILPEIVDNFDNKYNLKKISGLALKLKKELFINYSENKIENINNFPIPDYSQIKIDDYLNFRIGTRILSVEGSRGCPGRCIFCIDKKIGNPFRIKSPEKIINEIRYLTKKYNIKIIRFNDCLINHDTKRLEKISDLILENNLNILWGGMAKLTYPINKNLFNKMYRSGCRFLWFGIESASPKTLNTIKKDIDITKVAPMLKDAINAGIFTLTFWITNNPLENESDTKLSMDFLQKNNENFNEILLSKFRLSKGTEFYENRNLYKIRIKNSDILDPTQNYLVTNKNHDRLVSLWNDLRKNKSNNSLFMIDKFPIITEI